MTDTETTQSTAAKTVGILKQKPVRIALAVVGTIAAVTLVMGGFKGEKAPEFRTEAMRKTDITRGVSASGAIEAVDSVTIGSEVSGQVREVLVDFNNQVTKGQLLAVLDTETFEARVRQAQAQRDAAEADARVAESNYERQKRLAEGGLVAVKTMEDAGAQRDRSRASLRQAQASLTTAMADLAKANIRSPIDGIIVNRTVDPGQTVAASMSAPELFVVAKDLSRLQIKIMVDEADIGQVQEGQLVRFTVDAFPDDNFEGRVNQVRKQPEKTANVVTYVVIAEAPNPERKLLPGMTANADIVIEEHKDVLAAPASALRWRPEGAEARGQGGQGQGGQGQGGGAVMVSAGGGDGAGAAAGGGRGGFQRQNPAQQAEALSKQLGLDAAQKKQVTAIYASSAQKMRETMMAAMAGGDRSKIRETMQKAMVDTNAQISAVLKPDQKVKFEAIQKERAAQMAAFGGGRGAGQGGQQRMQRRSIYILDGDKPKELPVLVGINDGTLVEVRALNAENPIKEGMMVITGDTKSQQRSPQQGGGQGGGPRMMPFGGP